MIYTCTFNPSLDYYIELEEKMCDSKFHRARNEMFHSGGKGINVSIVLNNFNIPSTALGFLGGFTRAYYLDLLNPHSYIQPLFTNISSNTRINIKIFGKDEVDINAKGPEISDVEWQKFYNRLNKIDSRDIFILSGNIQESLHHKVYEMLEDLSFKKVVLVLDTNPKLLRKLLKYQPILIKPNIEELFEMFDEEIDDSIDKVVEKAKILCEEGAANVLVSLGDKGSVFISGGEVYQSNAIETKVISTVGAGDSMVAGFVLSLLRGSNSYEAYKYSVAASYATISGNNLATRELVEKFYKDVEVKQL